MTNGSLMKVESIAKCSPWSILRYFWPALSANLYWKPFKVFLRGAVLHRFYCIVIFLLSCRKPMIQYNTAKFLDSMSHIFSASILQASSWPQWAAAWRAVQPSLSFAFISTPACSNMLKIDTNWVRQIKLQYLHFQRSLLNEPLHLRCPSYLHEQINLSHSTYAQFWRTNINTIQSCYLFTDVEHVSSWR